jgi:hemoglobin
MRPALKGSMLLSAFLAAVLTAGAAQAQDEKPAEPPRERGSAEDLIYTNLREVINHGADLYNSGDWNGCYRLWEGSLMSLKPLLAHRPKLREAIDTGIANARQDPLLYRRAWVLRSVLDQVRSDIKGEKPADTPEPKDKVPVVTPEPKKKNLWERLGGEPGVTRLVDDFFNAVVADPKVDFFRGGKFKPEPGDIVKMKREMVEQVSQATGGPLKYNGPDMKKVHKDMGITNEQFDAVVGRLKGTLEKHKVADNDKNAILTAVNGYRKEVVQPKKSEDKKPEDKKPEDKKPEDKKPIEKKPEDKKPLDKKPEDKKPDDKKPVEKKEEKKPAVTASVHGHITFEGKPLMGGTIVFTNKEGKVEGKIAADGTYKVEGTKVGGYAVSINGAKENAIPAKYKGPETSGIVVDIKDGKQTIDLELK